LHHIMVMGIEGREIFGRGGQTDVNY
jgi:hypothetical protein